MKRVLAAGLFALAAVAVAVGAPTAAADVQINVTNPEPADEGYSPARDPATVSVDLTGSDLQDSGSHDVAFINSTAGNGTTFATATLSSEGRVSADWASTQPGLNKWSVKVFSDLSSTDTKTVGPFSFRAPGFVTVQREVDSSNGITGNDATVTAIGTDYQSTRSFTGSSQPERIDLEGVPNRRVVIDATPESYRPVRTVVENVTDPQTRIHLLSEVSGQTTIPVNDVEFDLRDRTGEYPEETTVLEVRRDYDSDGKIEQVWGDQFGASGRVGAVLRENSRVQLVIKNGNGQTRGFGTYVVDQGGELVPLDIAQISITPPNAGGFTLDSREINTTVNGDVRRAIRVIYSDDSETTEFVEVEIYEQNNKSNSIFGPTQLTGNDISQTVLIPETKKNVTTWVVDYRVSRDADEQVVAGQQLVGDVSSLSFPLSAHMLQTLGLAAILLVAGLFGGSLSRIGGVVVVALAWLLTVVGFLEIPLAFLLAASTVAVLFVVGVDRSETGGQPI